MPTHPVTTAVIGHAERAIAPNHFVVQ